MVQTILQNIFIEIKIQDTGFYFIANNFFIEENYKPVIKLKSFNFFKRESKVAETAIVNKCFLGLVLNWLAGSFIVTEYTIQLAVQFIVL